MSEELYDIFISFPLTDKDDKLSETINTKDFYIARKIYHVLTHLLHIKTFFSEETLLNNNSADFWEKIKEVIPKSKVLVIILNSEKDYKRKFCKMERDLYLKRDEKDRKIFFLVSPEVHKVIGEYDIMEAETGKPEVIRWHDLLHQQRFYNEVNNYFAKNDPGKYKEVKICLDCEKIFYKNNDIGTVCIHHRRSDITEFNNGKGSYFVRFNCCNKVIKLDNKNALYEISPGCVEEKKHRFGNDE